MKIIILKISLIALWAAIYSCSNDTEMKKDSHYNVARLKEPMQIDASWDKPQWKNVQAVDISNYMGDIPGFKPEAQAKMMYDDDNLYVIFHVNDQFVRCITNEINGPVWEDSAVEFFFAPDSKQPLLYFNLEINCGGTPLMHYNLVPRKEFTELPKEEIEKIEIAHTLPQIIDPEMKDPVTWTLEYRIPIAMLEKYSTITQPKKGVEWKANFYKIAENNSNHHYITWSVVELEEPDFHRPEFFGRLIFE
jgi:hypothetical protein